MERNRARRLGREAYRHLRPRLLGAYDLILLVFPAHGDAETPNAGQLAIRTEQLEFLFTKAGLLK
ncbi:hypothetical protein AGMMS50293_01940 [Spirochaetia bacterium]|nr:hypothetical protein AGMMS50293_01940 [Spirochaetia bacterium]